MDLNEGYHYHSVIFEENIKEEDKETVFKRYIGQQINQEPDISSEDIEMDRIFNRAKEVIGM